MGLPEDYDYGIKNVSFSELNLKMSTKINNNTVLDNISLFFKFKGESLGIYRWQEMVVYLFGFSGLTVENFN